MTAPTTMNMNPVSGRSSPKRVIAPTTRNATPFQASVFARGGTVVGEEGVIRGMLA